MLGTIDQQSQPTNGQDPSQQQAPEPRDHSRLTSSELSRLAAQIDVARLAMAVFRDNRVKFVKEYCGGEYSENATAHDVPVNFINQYVNIVVRNLIAQNPRVMLSTTDKSMKTAIEAMEDWANVEIDKMGLRTTLERGCFDALFSIGIAKVALATPVDSANSSWATAAGQPFAERVDLDDFVYDVNAKDFREARWMGHRVRVPLYAVMADERFDPEVRASLVAQQNQPYNQQGDERIGMIAKGYVAASQEEFEDMIDLWEIYIPSRKIIVTLPDQALSGVASSSNNFFGPKPLGIQDWVGPDCGPYHILPLSTVPGNAMPLSPIMNLYPLHRAANNIYRKLIRQCDRLKEMTFVRGASVEGGTNAMEGNDGDLLKIDNPEGITTVVMGGPNQFLVQFFESLRNLFSWFAGNLDSLGGLSPQAKTATQDTMLERNSSKGISDYQDRVVAWTSSILESLCWYWYHSPDKTMTSKYSPAGVPKATVMRQVHPQQRMQGRYEDLDISVDPYSLQHSTPQQRMAMLDALVAQMTPMMAMLHQQGIGVDWNTFFSLKAKYSDMPDLSSLFTIAEPPQVQDGGQGGGGGGGVGTPTQPGSPPGPTQRVYTRQSVPGRSQQGDSINAMNVARGIPTGGNPQNQSGARA